MFLITYSFRRKGTEYPVFINAVIEEHPFEWLADLDHEDGDYVLINFWPVHPTGAKTLKTCVG